MLLGETRKEQNLLRALLISEIMIAQEAIEGMLGLRIERAKMSGLVFQRGIKISDQCQDINK